MTHKRWSLCIFILKQNLTNTINYHMFFLKSILSTSCTENLPHSLLSSNSRLFTSSVFSMPFSKAILTKRWIWLFAFFFFFYSFTHFYRSRKNRHFPNGMCLSRPLLWNSQERLLYIHNYMLSTALQSTVHCLVLHTAGKNCVGLSSCFQSSVFQGHDASTLMS